jgi:hypothetical protein
VNSFIFTTGCRQHKQQDQANDQSKVHEFHRRGKIPCFARPCSWLGLNLTFISGIGSSPSTLQGISDCQGQAILAGSTVQRREIDTSNVLSRRLNIRVQESLHPLQQRQWLPHESLQLSHTLCIAHLFCSTGYVSISNTNLEHDRRSSIKKNVQEPVHVSIDMYSDPPCGFPAYAGSMQGGTFDRVCVRLPAARSSEQTMS